MGEGSETVGERLRIARERRGLSKPVAAELARVSLSVWRNVEAGHDGTGRPYRSTPKTLARMALAVGEDPVDLVRAAGMDPERIPLELIQAEQGTTEPAVLIVAVRDGITEEQVLAEVRRALAQLHR